jgi:hypothetical protein
MHDNVFEDTVNIEKPVVKLVVWHGHGAKETK